LQYVAGTGEGVTIRPGTLERLVESYKDDPQTLRDLLGDDPFELKSIIDNWVLSDNPELRFIPTDSIVLTIDKDAVRRSGMMMAGDSIPDKMHISLKGKRAVYKSEMMMYEMIAQCNWERPLYVAMTVGPDNYGHLDDYFVQEGLVYRITPFNTARSGMNVDTEKMYENLMTRFAFGGIDKPGIYLDETVTRMCSTHRRIFAQLASRLVQEGKNDMAKKVVEKVEQAIPPTAVPHSYTSGSLELARVWNTIGGKKEANDIALAVANKASEYLEWYLNLPGNMLLLSQKECASSMYQMHSAISILESAGSDKVMELAKKLDIYNQLVQARFYGSVGMGADESVEAEEEEYEEEESYEDDTL
jgi:hypothetical protein